MPKFRLDFTVRAVSDIEAESKEEAKRNWLDLTIAQRVARAHQYGIEKFSIVELDEHGKPLGESE